MTYKIRRVCTSCEWIFRTRVASDPCPKCGFIHSSGARYIYGTLCFEYAKTQKPWIDRMTIKQELKCMGNSHG